MSSFFNSNVFVEIGEAIGNIGKRLWPRASRGERMSESFRRLRDTGPTLRLDATSETQSHVSQDVIEGTFRIVRDEEDA